MSPLAITAAGIRATLDTECGLLGDLAVRDGGREVAPLHRAPWVGTGEAMPEDAAPHLARLGGDFLCAPFGAREDGSPLHGWPANAPWTVEEAMPSGVLARLSRPVRGAAVLKRVELVDGHPFAYQTHAFVGGSGAVPVANHAMVALPHGGLIRTSPKAFWETAAAPQETDPARGRSSLLCPARAENPRRFPLAGGGTADLLLFPWADRSEDFCMGVEAPGHRLGWTAVTRPAEGDLFLSLRDARALPMTMLWHSNRGRDYAPWSGRHVCLGVEEGAAAYLLPLSGAAVAPPDLPLRPDGRAEVRHVIGAVAWPSGEPVAEVVEDGDAVVVRGEGGAQHRLPFRAGFLGRD